MNSLKQKRGALRRSGRAEKKKSRAIIIAGILGSMFTAARIEAATFASTLHFARGLVTAQVQTVPLRQVLTELSHQSGVQVRWLNAGGSEPVSADFHQLPLVEALRRLLPQQNFLLLYHASQLQQIWITSVGQGSGEPLTIPKLHSSATRDDADDTKADEEKQSENEEEDENEEAQLSPQQAFTQAQDLALHGKNMARRLDALKWLANEGKDHPQSHAMLFQLANDSTDPAMQALAKELLADGQ